MAERKKYELTDEFIEHWSGKKLYRIKALIDFGLVVAGSLGGFVESENNLDHNGDAEVSGDAEVFGNAWVSGNAKVFGDAEVSGDAEVFGNAWVFGDAKVFGNAKVSGDAWVCKRRSIIWFSIVGTENGTLTVYKSKDGLLLATRGCFSGTVDEFLSKSAQVHDEKTKREYELLIEVAKSRILG